MRSVDPVLPVEEIYTNADINRNSITDKNFGYTFNYPRAWLDSQSNDRMIGVRRLKLIPSSHIFDLCFRIYKDKELVIEWEAEETFFVSNSSVRKPLNWFEGENTIEPLFIQNKDFDQDADNTFNVIPNENEDMFVIEANAHAYAFRYQSWFGPARPEEEEEEEDDDENKYRWKIWFTKSTQKLNTVWYDVPMYYTVTEDDGLEKIIHKIVEDFENIIWKAEGHDEIDNYRLRYEYDSNTGSLSFFVLDNEEEMCFFEMRGWSEDHGPNLINHTDTLKFFIKFLNQETNAENYKLLFLPSQIKEFKSEVWNRNLVQFHASFSVASRQYIGINEDFWESPTRLFHFNMSSTFNIKFSHDGIHWFLPRYSQFIVELCYIFNYKKVKVSL